MTTKIDTFEINGIIDTSQNVFGNVQKMCEAAGATFSHDPATGKYSVVILGEDDPIATFNDTNMLGSVILNTTDISEMYNAVSVEYAHKDLKDKRDVMHFKLDLEDTYTPLEVENRLNLSFDLVNNPIQAAYLGKIALQQTRFDRIINFRANYDYIGLSAGDVIQVVNTALGLEEDVVNPSSDTYSKWRIVTVEEMDDDTLGLTVNITALEYNTTVYSKNNLYREIRDQNTGIGPKRENVCLAIKDLEKLADDNAQKQVKPTLSREVYNEKAAQININETLTTVSDLDFFFNSGTTANIYDLGLNCVIPYDGEYQVEYQVSWGATHFFDGAGKFYLPDPGQRKFQDMVLDINGSTGTTSYANRDGSYVGDSLENTRQLRKFTFSEGDEIDFRIYLMSDFGPNHPNAGSFADAVSFVSTVVILHYLG